MVPLTPAQLPVPPLRRRRLRLVHRQPLATNNRAHPARRGQRVQRERSVFGAGSERWVGVGRSGMGACGGYHRAEVGIQFDGESYDEGRDTS